MTVCLELYEQHGPEPDDDDDHAVFRAVNIRLSDIPSFCPVHVTGCGIMPWHQQRHYAPSTEWGVTQRSLIQPGVPFHPCGTGMADSEHGGTGA
ncbi:hypothetical protein NYV37_09080 [Escherichia coli]|nr:hypothetical protein [Escherichia coli]